MHHLASRHLVRARLLLVFAVFVSCASGWRLQPRDVRSDNTTDINPIKDVDAGDCEKRPVEVLLYPGEQAIIITPGYSGKYEDGLECYWKFKLVGEAIFRVYCKKVFLKEKDYLIIAGGLLNSQKYDNMKGDELNITLSRNTLKIGIMTNKDNSRAKGFMCNIIAVPENEPICECGRVKASGRIVGGRKARRREFPWHVGLVAIGSLKPFCGGSIINSKYILTAAHCVKGMEAVKVYVVLGEFDISDHDNIAAEILKFIVHSGYDETTMKNDLALVEVNTLDFAELPSYIRPVCLPSIPKDYVGSTATVQGWGFTKDAGRQPNKLRKVNLKIISNENCNLIYQDSIKDHIKDDMICAYRRNKDSCQGDSGGALTTALNRKFNEIIGVVSWGYKCAYKRYPGVYSRVTENLDWIISKSSGGTFCPRPYDV